MDSPASASRIAAARPFPIPADREPAPATMATFPVRDLEGRKGFSSGRFVRELEMGGRNREWLQLYIDIKIHGYNVTHE